MIRSVQKLDRMVPLKTYSVSVDICFAPRIIGCFGPGHFTCGTRLRTPKQPPDEQHDG